MQSLEKLEGQLTHVEENQGGVAQTLQGLGCESLAVRDVAQRTDPMLRPGPSLEKTTSGAWGRFERFEITTKLGLVRPRTIRPTSRILCDAHFEWRSWLPGHVGAKMRI